MRKFGRGAGTLAVALVLIGAHSGVAAERAANPGDAIVGKATYQKYCVTCHGRTGDGQGPVGKGLNVSPGDFTTGDFKYGGTDQDLFEVISNGAASKGGSAFMAPWGDVIPELERWALVRYIRSLRK